MHELCQSGGLFSLIGADGYARPISNQVVGKTLILMKQTKFYKKQICSMFIYV